MKQLAALVMIAFLVPAAATVAYAENPCREDKAKFCKDAKANKKTVVDCLKEHSAELSAACKESVAKMSDPEWQKKHEEKKAAKKAEKQSEKKPKKKAEGKDAKPADKPAEGGATAPSEPAAPGGAETKP